MEKKIQSIMNSNLKKNYREAYTDLSKDLVAKIYAEDIARFDHKF